MNDVDERTCQLKSLVEKAGALNVLDWLHQQLSELLIEYERLKSDGETVTEQLTEICADKRDLQDSLLTAKLWIDERQLEIRAGKTIPLSSLDAHNKLENTKVAH